MKEIDLSINTELVRTILTRFVHTEITRTGLSRAVVNLSGGLDFSSGLLHRGRSTRT